MVRRAALVGAAGLLAAGALAVAGCDRNSAAAPAKSAMAAPVRVATAEQRDVPVRVEAIGWVEALNSVTVRPQIEGQIVEFKFDEGATVHAGDLLVRIDPRPFEAALREAEATLLRDQALAEDAESESKRVADLFERQLAADRERDQAQAQYASRLAQVQADEAAVDIARLRLKYCAIQSPIDGVAGARLVDVGNIVKANETALVVVNQINPIQVRFNVAEQHIGTVRQKLPESALPVEATLPDEENAVEHGKLVFVDNRVDPTTGMIELKAEFPNDAGRLWPGRFVRVALVVDVIADAVVVPAEAIQLGQKGKTVYVLRDDRTVDLRDVTTGVETGGSVVVTSGVKAGETVVTDGQLRLVPGGEATIVTEPATTAEDQP